MQPAVKSAMRTLDIIELVVAHPRGIIAQDIANTLAIQVSSLSYLLTTLVDRDYLSREGRRYYPGSRLDRLRSHEAPFSMAERARPLIQSMRAQLNETTSLFAVEGWELKALVTETADQTLRYSIQVGERTPLHCVAAGKVVLAALDDAELDRYFIETPLKPYTASTIVEESELRREIDKVRDAGYATTRDEYTLGICGLGKAVIRDGQLLGTLGLAIPTARFDEIKREEGVALLEKAAAQLGRALD